MRREKNLSSILSNIYIEEFERKTIDKYKLKSFLWLRYVDDTFVIWPHKKKTLNRLLKHPNSIKESILFTIAVKKDKKITFLGVLVQRKNNSKPVTKVYKKFTNTRQYLHFNSNYQYATKTGVAKCLYKRAATICSIEEDIKTEIEDITRTLRLNSYLNKTLKIAKEHKEKKTQKNKRLTTLMVIPMLKIYLKK